MIKSYRVWTWKHEGVPVFVGWGKFDNKHPAKRVWGERNKYDSPLNAFLRGLAREPTRDTETTAIELGREEARALANAKRSQLASQGFTLLESRPSGTRSGGGSAKAVLSPELQTFNSVRDAAAHVGVNASTITRWCQTVDSGWDYIGE